MPGPCVAELSGPDCTLGVPYRGHLPLAMLAPWMACRPAWSTGLESLPPGWVRCRRGLTSLSRRQKAAACGSWQFAQRRLRGAKAPRFLASRLDSLNPITLPVTPSPDAYSCPTGPRALPTRTCSGAAPRTSFPSRHCLQRPGCRPPRSAQPHFRPR